MKRSAMAILAGLLSFSVPTYASLTDGLVAYFAFEGNAADSSGHANDGTAFGGVSFEAGVIGSAARFDGSTGYVASNSSVGNLGSNATIAFWFRPEADSFARGTRVFEKDNRAYWIFGTYGGMEVSLRGLNSYGPPETTVTVGDPLGLAGKWSHVAMREGGGMVDVFLDGDLVSSLVTPVTSVVTDAPLYFGKSYYWNTAYYAGLIDEARIYERGLSNTEIRELALRDSALVAEPATIVLLLSGLVAFRLSARQSRGSG